jgi:hypothetical protein
LLRCLRFPLWWHRGRVDPELRSARTWIAPHDGARYKE